MWMKRLFSIEESLGRMLIIALFLLPILSLAACDSDSQDGDDPDPVGFPGDSLLLGMWTGPESGGIQEFLYLEYFEAEQVLRSTKWEHDMAANCFDLTARGEIPAAGITRTTLNNGDGTFSTYVFSNGGSTLTITDSSSGTEPTVLTRSNRTPESMVPSCP